MSEEDAVVAESFRDLALPEPLLRALDTIGYETPSPIQTRTIPHLVAGRDLLGHAPTGTGKTAAFTLPMLARLDLTRREVQAMVLTPTRELAIQVAEAVRRYAMHLEGFQVLPIYGGQDYSGQIRQLARGVHVVVGTPGRVMDHMRKGRLTLDALSMLVLDEADEMLRMGFIDDVEWVIEQTPDGRQMALFSATMPAEVQRIARAHLKEPVEVAIEARTAAAETIRQRWWLVSGVHKIDALTRILEVEPFDALLIFVRTKTATLELAERLQARGFAAAPLNGDMPQKQREQTVERLRAGGLDILVATDVAARGLDVERISHVVNYDIPYDIEAYIHRIGRTGRAGRAGEAILFVAPRERRMLHAIERSTRQPIEALTLPSTETVNNKRIADFKQRITDALAIGELDFLQNLVEQYQQEHDVPAIEIAAGLARLAIGDQPLLLAPDPEPRRERFAGDGERRGDRDERPRERGNWRERDGERPRFAPRDGERPRYRDERGGGERGYGRRDEGQGGSADRPRFRDRDGNRDRPSDHNRPAEGGRFSGNRDDGGQGRFGERDERRGRYPDRAERGERTERGGERGGDWSDRGERRQRRAPSPPEPGMERFRIDVGHAHGVKPGNIVGAIANEAGLDSQHIGRIDIHDDYSVVDLPAGMPREIFEELRRARVRGQRLNIAKLEGGGGGGGDHGDAKPRPKPKRPFER